MRCNINIESHIRIGHNININQHIAIRSVCCGSPTFSVIICSTVTAYDWEIISNILSIQRIYSFYSIIGIARPCIARAVISGIVVAISPIIITKPTTAAPSQLYILTIY